MRRSAFALLATTVLVLGACGPDVIARDETLAPTGLAAVAEVRPRDAGAEALVAAWNVRRVSVSVPETLTVSEANLYFPLSDIVWRGEPHGDRRAQVRAILEEAFDAATAGMRSGPEVDVEVTLRRFHALTEKARYSVGGLHALRYDLTIRDAATGAVLDGPRRVVADVRASGGQAAIEEDARGLTQRVVIVHALSQSALRALSTRRAVPAGVPLTRLHGDLGLGIAAASGKDPPVGRGHGDFTLGIAAAEAGAATAAPAVQAAVRARIAAYLH